MNTFLSGKIFINSQDKYCPEKYNCHQSKAFPVSFQCHRLSTVIHRQWQESVKCLKQHEGEPSEIVVVQISRTECIMKFYDDMVD